MNENGWGWSASDVRQLHLVEWLARQPEDPAVMIGVEEFYNVLPDQSRNNWETAHSDLRMLEDRGLIDMTQTMGDMEGVRVEVKAACRDFAGEVRSERENKGRRRTACRDAMVHWLYALDAVTAGPEMPPTEAMLEDSRHGIWFGQPFSPADLDQAAAWLHQQGLVGGAMAEEAEGPILLHLTDEGVRCAEDFQADTASYVAAQRHMPASGPSLHIGTNSGPFQVAGDNASQVQHIGASTEELRKLITSLADTVRQFAPDADGIDEAEQEALAAARPGAVDRSVLQRFGAWVISVFQSGTTAALVPMVTAATNQMLTEATHAIGHLG